MAGRRIRDTERPDRWFTRNETARAFAVTTGCLDARYRSMFSPEAIKKDADGKVYYDLRRCIDDFCSAQIRRGSAKALTPQGEDDEAPSEWLEKKREEETRILQLKRAEMEGQLIARDVVHRTWTMLAAKLRSFGGFLQREHGRLALEELNSVLDDCGREFEAAFGARNATATVDASPDGMGN